MTPVSRNVYSTVHQNWSVDRKDSQLCFVQAAAAVQGCAALQQLLLDMPCIRVCALQDVVRAHALTDCIRCSAASL
jgi:hypothetical protein